MVVVAGNPATRRGAAFEVSMKDFLHKCVVITGASRGLGRVCAEAFAARGAELVLGVAPGRHRLSEKLVTRMIETSTDIAGQGSGRCGRCGFRR